jgi:outer membrane protein
MKKIINSKINMLAVAVLALSCTSSWAQSGEQPWLIRARALQLNWTNQQNNGLGAVNVSAQNLTIPEVDITYFLNKNIALELSLTYPQKIHMNVAGTDAGSLKGLPPSLVAQYHFTELGNLKPYLGIGFNYTSFTNVNILNGAASVDSSSTGAVAQAGFDYMLDKNWGLNFDAKYIKMKTDVYVAGIDKGQLGLNPNTYSIGIAYRY